VLTAFVLLLCLLGAIVPLSRRRAESIPAGWFQISSYRNPDPGPCPRRGRVRGVRLQPEVGSVPAGRRAHRRALRAPDRPAVAIPELIVG
jgi:hypothetical protein